MGHTVTFFRLWHGSSRHPDHDHGQGGDHQKGQHRDLAGHAWVFGFLHPVLL
ncbi:Hypothetical protein RAK1035_0433 [Roseovarius sp. AK1035]|nr:Hypothetical protein RAK1035_0433 [Roseovarius sp. AK1035]